jgi:hypothetical protein
MFLWTDSTTTTMIWTMTTTTTMMKIMMSYRSDLFILYTRATPHFTLLVVDVLVVLRPLGTDKVKEVNTADNATDYTAVDDLRLFLVFLARKAPLFGNNQYKWVMVESAGDLL